MTDHEFDPEIAIHYEADQQEEGRLGTGDGRLEYLRTREIMARYLPPPPAVILDVGGAAGGYALPLARDGYEMHLIDPVARHIGLARSASAAQADAPLASATTGDARQLRWTDGSVDAVLLLGPLYHLTEQTDRLLALGQALRVLRPGGMVIIAAISRFASTYSGLFDGFVDEPGFEDVIARDVREGQHRNPERRPGWFTTAYFHHPDELRREVGKAGFELEAVFAVEGPGAWLPGLGERLDDEARRDRLLESIRRVEREPTLLGASPHLLAVGRRA